MITEIEALSWINADKGKEKIVREFIVDANVLALSTDIVAQCIKIRRSLKIKTPDAIIAATAIVYNLSLLTSDSDFNSIQGLTIVNPRDI